MCLHTISTTSPARKVSPAKEKRTNALNAFTRTNMIRGDDMDKSYCVKCRYYDIIQETCFYSLCCYGKNFRVQEEAPQDKPPIDIKPRWMMLEHRNREIIEAMHRRVDACLDNSEPITLDPQWIMELFENNKELLARCKP